MAAAATCVAHPRPNASRNTGHFHIPRASNSNLSFPIPNSKPKPLQSAPLATAEAEAEVATSQSPKSKSRRNAPNPRTQSRGKQAEAYLGYEKWSLLPSAMPKPSKPRSAYKAASLAYLGDCVYELYARRHFLYPPSSIDVYNERVTSIVRCESQDALLKKLLKEDYLTEDERDILRWGRNIGSSKTRTRRRAGSAVYSSASSLETLIGHLYLTDENRLEELMCKLGFSADASAEKLAEKKA